ncbi:hypothetical protein TSAR_010998, partial [Trichomalopsis sarcophagae]
MDMALDYSYNYDSILILSDSKSVLQGLNSNNAKIMSNPILLDIKRKYQIYIKNNPEASLEMIWVPGHCGIEGHYNLSESLAKINVVDSPNCQCGQANENLNH